MVRISKMADYALVVLKLMCINGERSLSAASIADLTQLPVPSVRKTLLNLASFGLVSSVRGTKGGYQLAKDSHDITILEVVEAIDGPIFVNHCADSQYHCSIETQCEMSTHWQWVNRQFRQLLFGLSVYEMSQPLNVDVRNARIPVEEIKVRVHG